MTKDEAINECKDSCEKYGRIFGDWFVIKKGKEFEPVSERYLKNYKYFGKKYHTEIAGEPKDVDEQESFMKGVLLSMCKTRKQRRVVERKYKSGGIKDYFFKIFMK